MNDNTNPETVSIDDAANTAAALNEKLADSSTPGFAAEFDPDEADRAGAFNEDALTAADAAASAEDLVIDADKTPD